MARLPQNARLWKERAEIDYIGPFVKAWAAFNAWFREETGSRRDRDGIDYVKTRPNPVRAEILPLLAPQGSGAEPEAAQEFKLLIADLHRLLEQFHIEVARDDDVLERITFRAVQIKRRADLPQSRTYNRHVYTVQKTSGNWESNVVSESGVVRATVVQPQYDESALITDEQYSWLSVAQQAQLRSLYQECCPRPMSNMLVGIEPAIPAGDFHFRCTSEELLFSLIEVIYALRNSLLHGELQPDERAFRTYEPAYRIVMKFLECIR